MKKLIVIGLIVLVLCAAAAGIYMAAVPTGGMSFDINGVCAPFETGSGLIYRMEDGRRVPFDLRGVRFESRGAQYDSQQLELIAAMNVNTVLIGADAPEEFYRALASFNEGRERPIYLLQGVTCGTDAQYRAMVDRLYRSGVQQWTVGYAVDARRLAAEDDRLSYRGECLITDSEATKSEARLARAGDVLLSYEAAKYGTQRLVAFVGDPQTDPLRHDVRTADGSLNGNIDFEHILVSDSVRSGLFALYCAEAYESFFEWEPYYRDWYDENGESNPYRAYLIELCDHHEMPVVISGLTASTSRAAEGTVGSHGTTNGGQSEREQAQRVSALYEDVILSGCAGVLLNEWTDEWQLWCNVQDPAQAAGVIALEPGAGQTVCRVDGAMSDWEQVSLLTQGAGMLLQIQYDARFVYFRVYAEGYDFERETIFIPIDTAPHSGADRREADEADCPTGTDFIIVLAGRENSRLLAHADFDGTADMLPQEGAFREIYSVVRSAAVLEDGRTASPVLTASGALKYAQGSSSAADFAVRGSGIEIRIPWKLLGFENPARCLIKGADGKREYTSALKASLIRSDGTRTQTGEIRLDGWKDTATHIRMKEAYYALRDVFAQRMREKGE